MDVIKLLRRQVSTRLAYLDSAQACDDATFPEMNQIDRFEALTVLSGKAIALREVLADIDNLYTAKAAA